MKKIDPLQPTSRFARLKTLILLGCLVLVWGCSTTSTRTSGPITFADCPIRPAPPAALMIPPPPSGSFLTELSTFQRDVQQTLSASPTSSAPSKITK